MSKRKPSLPKPVLRDVENKLLAVANNYITAHGGSAVIIGPTVVMHLPRDAKHVYYLAIKFTGKKPSEAGEAR